MTFRITSTQYGWKKIASITQLNPLKFKTWKLQEKTLSRVTSIRIWWRRNDPLGKKEIPIQDAFPNLTGDEREFVKTGINIERLMLFEDEDG
jgi:hypothetical protein